MRKQNSAQAAAAKQLLAMIEDLSATAQVAQETNRTYLDFIRCQALTIQCLEADVKLLQAEIISLKTGGCDGVQKGKA